MKFFFSLLFTFFFSIISFSQLINPSNWPGMVGYWTFDDSLDIENATVGNNLELFGTQQYVHGVSNTDGATRIGVDNYYKCTHGIAANGGGSAVNEYTILLDLKIPINGHFYTVYQTNMNNNNDADIFINTTGNVGVLGTGYTSVAVIPDQWYRLVVSIDLDNTFKYYIDGNLILDGNSQSIDGRYSLDQFFYWFRDDNGEDHEFDISNAAIFNYSLSDNEVNTLGGYGHTFAYLQTNPYLQTPTPTSMYVSWHSHELSNTYVQYGNSSSLGQQQNGNYENISGKIWHTVKLTGLTPDTEYFYRCISGTDTSAVSKFRTIPNPTDMGKHVRFLLLGDSRSDINRTSLISQVAEQQLIQDYGVDWHNSIDFAMQMGDIAHNDNINNYINEYFTPYSNLTNKIPMMVSVGNHEYGGGAVNYFKYMKYEELTGTPYSSSSNNLNEKFYKFQVGNSLFVAVNSNSALSITAQTNWLQTVLNDAENNADIDFVFVYNHHPGHSEIWPDGNTSYIENDIIPLLKQYSKVSMLSYGHSHGYERGEIEIDTTTVGYQNDFYLLLSGGAGSELDRWGMYSNQQDYPEIHMTLDHYNYSIVDIDCDNKSWTAKTFSLGHHDLALNNVVIDKWYQNKLQNKPNTPTGLSINRNTAFIQLVAPSFSGVDSLMTSQFQLTNTIGDYSSPLQNVQRDWHNLYGDSGSPNYIPTDLNAGIDIKVLGTNIPSNDTNTVYGWRVRYRDFNLKWSNWSEEFIINENKDSIIINLASCNPLDTGILIQNYTNSSGFDSVVTTITSLLPHSEITLNLTTCNPADTGTIVQNLNNVFGCDSTLTIIKTLVHSYDTTLHNSTCLETEAGTVIENFNTIFGCDSVVKTITELLPSNTVLINDLSSNPLDTGTVIEIFMNKFGCDSVVTTITKLNPEYGTAIKDVFKDDFRIRISPNPTKGISKIEYMLAQKEKVAIKIYDSKGRLVKIICNNLTQTKGNHFFIWNMKKLKQEYRSAYYYCNFNFSNKIITKAIVYVK